MLACSYKFFDSEFTQEEINYTANHNRLLTIEIELAHPRNQKSPNGHTDGTSISKSELTTDEVCGIISQAKEMGARKIVILNEGLSIDSKIINVVKFIRGLELVVEMVTSNCKISNEIARQLFDCKANIIFRVDVSSSNIHDISAEQYLLSNTFIKVIDKLKAVGYPAQNTFLAVSFILCQKEADKLTDIWQWLNNQNIITCFGIPIPQNYERQFEYAKINLKGIHDVFGKIADNDIRLNSKNFHYYSPWVGNKCQKIQYSCFINSWGDVQPCIGVSIPVGNVREEKISNIIQESEVIGDCRDYKNTIQGPCHECEKSDTCHGCRGLAYQLTDNYLASDPICWRNREKQNGITKLPFEVDTIIPHKLPMRVIDKLTRLAEKTGEAVVRISSDMIFAGESGELDEVVYLELMAQTAAALGGFRKMGSLKGVSEGFLSGIKKFSILNKAYVGDLLKISVRQDMEFDNFYIMNGTVERNGEVLAKGEFKLWHNVKQAKKIFNPAK